MQRKIEDIAQDKSISLAQRVQALLKLGLEELDLDLGVISQVSAADYTIMFSMGRRQKAPQTSEQ